MLAARLRMAPSPELATGMLFVGRDSSECRTLLKGVAEGLGNSEKLARLVLLERPRGEMRPPVVAYCSAGFFRPFEVAAAAALE